MAKKQLKKLNQPKKYLQGGSNLGSVSQIRQNPYYIGQVGANAAQEQYQSSQQQIAQAQQDALQRNEQEKQVQNQELNSTISKAGTNVAKALKSDYKDGRFGNLFSKNLQGQAAMNISAGTQVAPMYAAPATTTIASNVGSLTPGAAEVGANLANTSTNVVSGVNAATAGVPAAVAPTGEFVTQGVANTAGKAAGTAASAVAIPAAVATVGGQIWKHTANDKRAYTSTQRERTGNMGGSIISGAGTGVAAGAQIGGYIAPWFGPAAPVVEAGAAVVGGLIGGTIGGVKAGKENKAAIKESQRLQEQERARRNAFQGAFVNSRLTGADTGFGLNSSTNMNNDFTNQYQVARTGGVTGIQEDRRTKTVPGGKIVPIEGTDAVEFKGKSHENGGVTIDKNTEVEGGETMDQVAMNNNNKQDYIFSKYLKLGGKSFAQRHKEILKGSGSQADIQQLAAMQEKVAGRNPQQVAAYGGFHKYATGGTPCPDCPPGTVCDPATGACVPDQDTPSSYDWQAPVDKQTTIAAQNGTTNAPAKTPNGYIPVKLPFTALESEKFDPKGKMQAWARSESKAMMDKSMAESEAYDAEKKKAMDVNMTYTGAKGDSVGNYSYDEASGYYTDKMDQGVYSSTPKRILYKDGKPDKIIGLPGYREAFRESPEDVAGLNKAGIYKNKNGSGTTSDWSLGDYNDKGEFIDYKDNPAFAVEKGYDVPGYSATAGVKPPDNAAPAITDMASLEAAYNAGKITLGEYRAKTKELEPAPSANTTTTSNADNTNSVIQPTATTTNTGTQPIDQEEQDWRNHWIKQGYVFNAAGERELPAGKKLVVYDDGSEQIVDDTQSTAGTATYTTPTGITPNGNKQSATQTDNTVTPDGAKLPANTSNVQGGVGATTTNDKLVGSKTSGFLPTFENAKENPLWTKENYPAWKSEVHSAITDTDRQQKIVDYLSNYKGDYSAEVQKRIKGKTGQDLLTAIETLATDNKPGIFHEAVRQALEATKTVPTKEIPKEIPKNPEKPKEEETPLPKKYEPCPPGTYRSGDGTCKDVGDVPQGNRISGTMLAGLGQLVPVGAALANPYKIAPGIVGAPSVKGALMPRVNLNQERASAIQQNVAYKNAVVNQNAGPASLVAMQSANTKTNQEMLKIDQQEQFDNFRNASEENKMGMQASMFNAENQQKSQMFNTEFNQKERQYRREDILGALDTGAARIAGIVKDDRAFKADERLANALDETGSYDRFTILEQLNREAKRKNSPYANTTEAERRRIAAAMHRELNPEGYVGKSEYTKLQEENAKMKKEQEEAAKKNQAKFGGARQYVSRLGELSGVRGTKAKL